MKRVFYLIFSVAILSSLILSACASSAETTTAPSETDSTAPLATQTQATMPETTEPMTTEPPATAPPQETPAATTGASGEEVTVTIGFTSSLTGNQEVSSKRQVAGFTLWLNELNNAGGITLSDGTVVKFDFVTYDDESSTERVQELYTRLITEDNATFLISPYSSGLTSAASIVAEQNGKLMITVGAAEDAAYKTGNTSLFQLYTPGSLYMASTVDLLTELDPAAKIALVYESDKFSTSVIEGVKPYLEQKGFEVVLDESYASDTADFGPIVNKIASSGATVLLGGGHYNDGTALARSLYERVVGLDLIFLLVAPADSKFPELGDAAMGVMTSSQWELAATFTEEAATAAGKEWFGRSGEDFAAAYQAADGDPPTYHAAGGYAAGLVLQKAIIDADSVDPEAVRDALNAMDIVTFYGAIKFDTSPEAHGLQIAHQMVVVQWQKDEAGELKRVVIAPEDVKKADPIFPLPTP